jgi:hypothetical protein
MNKKPRDERVSQSSASADFCKENIYRLPICGVKGTPNQLFGPIRKQVLTMDDVKELFGIPKKSIYNFIHSAPTDPLPIPFLKRGSINTFPTQAFRVWLLKLGHAKQLEDNDGPALDI